MNSEQTMPIDIDPVLRMDQSEDLKRIAQHQYAFQHSYNFDCHATKPNLFHPMMATHHMHYPLAGTKWLLYEIDGKKIQNLGFRLEF